MKTKEAQAAELREMAQIAAHKLGIRECKKCLGTGREYFDTQIQAYKPCDCVLRAAKIFTIEKFEKQQELKQKAEKLLQERELVN